MPRLPLLPPNWEDDPIFDGNAIDPAYVPGVSNPGTGELTPFQAIRMLLKWPFTRKLRHRLFQYTLRSM